MIGRSCDAEEAYDFWLLLIFHVGQISPLPAGAYHLQSLLAKNRQ